MAILNGGEKACDFMARLNARAANWRRFELQPSITYADVQRGAISRQGVERPLSILLVAHRFPPFMGGVEMHTFEVGRRMIAKGHSVRVLTGDPTVKTTRDDVLAGMRVSRIPVYPRSSDIFFAPGLYGEVLRAKADIIHIQGFHTFMPPIAALAAIRNAAAFVMTFHSGGHSSELRNAMRRGQCAIFRPLINRADKLIAVSEFEMAHFSERLRIPKDRFIVVPNGAEIEAPADTAPINRDAPLIVSIGRLERYKGHHRAIAAFAELLKHRPAARLRICGEGPYKAELLKLVGRLGLEASVTIGGVAPTERHEIAAILAAASVVVLLSDYEAHPVAALEALSLRRPILASNTTGFAEMAAKGLLQGIEPDAPPQVAAIAMLKLIDGPAVSVPGALVTGWDECTNNLVKIYREVLAARFGIPREPASPNVANASMAQEIANLSEV